MANYFLLWICIALVACSSAQVKYADTPIEHKAWDDLVKKYVRDDGKVNYEGFINDSLLLNTYLDTLSNNHPNPKTWSEPERLAYWINAYNAYTVKLIIIYYPLKSIKDIKLINIPFVNTPWQIKFFKIGGVEYNLDMIEHKVLRKQFNEPRIHFAINCASKSCPDLRNEAFTAVKLEKQLTEQAFSFINNPNKNIVTVTEVKLSKIFSWFQGDFTKKSTLTEYISKYSNAKPSNDVKIKYLKYNWSLNN